MISKTDLLYQEIADHEARETEYGNIINDLTLSLSMWINDYPFDEDHKCKQRRMVDNACFMIGKPRTMEELANMLGLSDDLIEDARQRDEEVAQCKQ